MRYARFILSIIASVLFISSIKLEAMELLTTQNKNTKILQDVRWFPKKRKSKINRNRKTDLLEGFLNNNRIFHENCCMSTRKQTSSRDKLTSIKCMLLLSSCSTDGPRDAISRKKIFKLLTKQNKQTKTRIGRPNL